MALLEVAGVTKEFGGLKAVRAVSLHLDQGQIVSLIGPNGAGKTTLFNCITGTMPPDAGSVRFNGEELVGLPPHEVARRGISRTFQHIRVFGQMSVLENVMVGRDFRGRTGIFGALLRPPRVGREEARNRERCLEVLALFGERLLPRLGQPARELSYANRRRLEMARALVAERRLLLVDEPFDGLDAGARAIVGSQVAATVRRGTQVVLATHHAEDVPPYVTKRLALPVMRAGARRR
jgi:branched-chain amino acid transport system permease protein